MVTAEVELGLWEYKLSTILFPERWAWLQCSPPCIYCWTQRCRGGSDWGWWGCRWEGSRWSNSSQVPNPSSRIPICIHNHVLSRCAVQEGHAQVVEILLSKGASLLDKVATLFSSRNLYTDFCSGWGWADCPSLGGRGGSLCHCELNIEQSKVAGQWAVQVG